MKTTQYVQIEDTSRVGEARRLAVVACRNLCSDASFAGKAVIIASELANNLVKHATQGELIPRVLQWPDAPGIEFLALDRGPGIGNLNESLRDGFSSRGSMGTGLGAVRRFSSLFDIHTAIGKGTAVLSRVYCGPPPEPRPPRPFEIGAVCLPVKGEDVCGDAWAVNPCRDGVLVILVDGLGHGFYATEAAAEALRSFQKNMDRGPAEILEIMHGDLRATRGAAAAVARLEWRPGGRIVRYAGVGNISGQIVAGQESRSMLSHNGTVGLAVPRIQEFTVPWPEDGILLLYSDGLATHWSLNDYPELQDRHPAIISGVLFRDHNRIRDDSMIVIIKEGCRSL